MGNNQKYQQQQASAKPAETAAPTEGTTISTAAPAQMSTVIETAPAPAAVETTIVPAVVETPAPVVVETPVAAPVVVEVVSAPVEAPVVESAPASKYSFALTAECLDLLAQIEATKDPVAIIAIAEVLEYIDSMGVNKTMDAVTGGNHQVKLFSAVKSIINSTSNNFQLSFATLLRLFDEMQDGPMHGAYLFRFTEDIRLNTDDRKSFNNIMNLLSFTAPLAGRQQAVKQINFQKTLEFTFTQEGQRRVLQFFNV